MGNTGWFGCETCENTWLYANKDDIGRPRVKCPGNSQRVRNLVVRNRLAMREWQKIQQNRKVPWGTTGSNKMRPIICGCVGNARVKVQ